MKKITILFTVLSIIVFSGFTEENQNSLISTNILQFDETASNIAQRDQALPLLDLKSSIETGKLLLESHDETPVKYDLSIKSKKIVTEILSNIYNDSLPELKPVITPEDLLTSQNGEEYQLKRILESDFKEENWTTAYKLITNFLSVDHSEKIKSKAHFYRAQVLFFQDKYRESFMEFTLAEDTEAQNIKPWIDTILNYLHKLKI